MDGPRYAIYFVPPGCSDLYRFGARFLGYDCYGGDDLGHPPDIGLTATAWEELTREPRRYGFHATLKAPFGLQPPFTEADLIAELDRFSALPHASISIAPTLRAIGRFIAIVSKNANAAVDRLASDCVTVFDRFRRPLTPQERNRRIAAATGVRQIANIDRWGYPFVFEDFRFHMTLTGAIDASRHGAIIALLRVAFDRVEESRSLPITQLVLARQDAPAARFRVVRAANLTASPADG